MKYSSIIFNDRNLTIRFICLLLAFCLLVSTVLLLLLKSKSSNAWLYDEESVDINYSVAELDFDLSSNHMYFYYNKDTEYNTVFKSMLNSLNTYNLNFENKNINEEGYIDGVKALFHDYYPSEMIDELQTAYDNNATSQMDYDDATKAVYDKYSGLGLYMFKIKSVDLDSIDIDKPIWYYYSKDLINLYYDEFVVQEDATGVKSSTINLGVKLKGGTTFSNVETNNYYDTHFDDMVTAYTMKFENTGTADLYLNLGVALDENKNSTNTAIAALILPYNFNLSDLTHENYPEYVDGNGKILYHNLITGLLSNAKAATSGEFTDFTYSATNLDALTFDQLKTIINNYNTYSMTTYKGDESNHYNMKVNMKTAASGDGIIKSVKVGMLCWADYEKCKDHYGVDTSGGLFDTDNAYDLIKYDFQVNIKSSLKNSDLGSSSLDWDLMYNKKQDYDKYIGLSNFDVEGYAYFAQNDGTNLNAKEFMEDGYILCDYVNEDAKNYITKFRFNLNYRGYSTAYIRVRLIEQFTNAKNQIVAINQIKFKLADNWIDNRLNDLYFYSKKLYSSTDKDVLTTTGKAKQMTVPVIEGLSDTYANVGSIDSTLITNQYLKMRLSIYIEAVQPNRTEEYWGIDENEIPTEDATTN